MSEGRQTVPRDTRWSELAALECARLATMSGGAEHIGSTAVPGVGGLDHHVIDLLVGVRMLDRRADQVVSALGGLGYEKTSSRMPGAVALKKRGAIDYDVFLVELGGREWKRATALRDYLRRHGDDARTYARGLREAMAAGDEEKFEEAKQALIALFTHRAEKWRLTHPRD
ncbi:MAG: GrpB family protein [Actinobacteria bacterium]|nr:GrpB family protein [Actinomycetota bacterium]